MNYSIISLTITASNKCPLYQSGDEFRVSQNTLFLPNGKPACLILASDIGRVLIEISDQNASTKDIRFDCNGCTGSISLAGKREKFREEQIKHVIAVRNVAKILSDFSMFQSLEKNQIEEIVTYIRLTRFAKGELIIKKGDPGKNLYIILAGKVEVLGEKNIRIAMLGKGDVFGEMSLLSGDPVGADIKVVEDAKVIYLQSRSFRKILHKFPSLQLYLARLLSKRLAQTNIAGFKDADAGMSGKLSETPPPEICQTINLTQKTGILKLYLTKGEAIISFREGNIIRAGYGKKTGIEAFYEILKDTEGRFSFHPDLPADDMKMPELGHFMCLLMEGMSKMDEERYYS